MSLEADLLSCFLKGATLEVRSAVAPPFTVDLGAAAGAPPGPLTSIVKPTLILRRDGVQLFKVEPAGAADTDAWKVSMAVVVAVVVGAVVLAFILSRK